MSLATSGALSIGALAQQQAAQAKTASPFDKRAHASAQDFEAVFLSSMFQQMFTGIKGDGPFGGSQGVGVWRSFLTDQYAKSIAKAGGIGIAKDVYHTLLQHQAARSQAQAAAHSTTSG
jgi:Rod binding domain-containing protein